MIFEALFLSVLKSCVENKHRTSYGQLFFKTAEHLYYPSHHRSSLITRTKKTFIAFIATVFLSLSPTHSFAAQQCSAHNISVQQHNAPNRLIETTRHVSDNDAPYLSSGAAPVKQYTYRILKRLPHDEHAFTQGLAIDQNTLYESTGLLGQSEIRKLDATSGKIQLAQKLATHYFGEGISIVDDHIVQLTLGTEHVFVYDKKHLKQIKQYKFNGEGWGITSINKQLLISDGSATLKWLNNTDKQLKDIQVTENGIAVSGLNELEYANGHIYANVWPGDCIAQIDPNSGNIESWINLNGLYQQQSRSHWTAVLNGIAYRNETDTFFVTGKYWPFIYELEISAEEKSSEPKNIASTR